MNRKIKWIVLWVLFTLLSTAGLGDDRDGHSVTIRIIYTNRVEVENRISSDTQMLAENNFRNQSTIRWDCSPLRKKITVSGVLVDFDSPVILVPYNTEGGSPTGKIKLGRIDRDLLATQPGCRGHCQLNINCPELQPAGHVNAKNKIIYTITDIE